MARLPHPIQYQGSKRNLAADILNFLPSKIDRFVEPFAGTGAISVAIAAQSIARNFWLNDLNQPLIELLELIIEKPEIISSAYSTIWSEQHSDSVGHYAQIRAEFNRTKEPKLFLYLLARCVKGAVRYNSEGLFNQSPDKRRKGTQPERMRENIIGVSALLQHKCKFTSLDYRDVLAAAKSSDFVYMDPPYQGVCGDRDLRYFAGINFDDFVVALADLNRRGVDFAISYDGKRGDKTFGVPLPKELGLQRIELEVGRSAQSTLLGRTEITTESLYLSPGLQSQELPIQPYPINIAARQLTLLENHGQYPAIAR
jgi:DNA adenine methylase